MRSLNKKNRGDTAKQLGQKASIRPYGGTDVHQMKPWTPWKTSPQNWGPQEATNDPLRVHKKAHNKPHLKLSYGLNESFRHNTINFFGSENQTNLLEHISIIDHPT